jgi:hypothetical protein
MASIELAELVTEYLIQPRLKTIRLDLARIKSGPKMSRKESAPHIRIS